MAYVIYTPTGLFTKAMFNFSPNTNYLFSGIINVSVSDGFSNYDYALGLINSSNYTMNPYSNEIIWSQQVKDNIKSTLNIISAFANIVFSEVIDYDTSGFGAYSIASPADVGIYSDINISYMNANSTNLLGMSSGSTDLFGYPGSRGDVLINVTGSAFTQEGVTFSDYSKSRQVLLHELGHSLGLSHPFSAPNQISSNYKDLINAGFDKLGFNMANSSYIDKEYFTMMSYDDQSNISNNNAFTPMIFDVIALVNAYGEGTGTTGAGNDTINAGNRGYRTYFDKDGVDTVNLSLYSSGVYFNMGVVITDATHLVGVAMSLVDAQQTIFDGGNPAALRWFYGEYENAVGSVSGDLLIGNSLGNNIDAGSGDDIIFGGGGNDVLNGGIGQDVAKYSLNRDKYIVSSSVGFYTVSSASGEEGSDTLIDIETLSFADITGGIGGFIDTTPPTVSTFNPVDEATAVTISSNIVVTFNETIQRGSGDIVLKTDSGTTVATYSQNSSNATISASTLTINPTADLNYSTGYKVEFSAGSVKDTAGNNYAGTTTYNFTTGAAPDTTPPTVSTFSPVDEATSVSIGTNIVSTFSEAIQRGTGDIVLKTAAGTTVATYSQTSSNVTISGNALTINPSADLDYSTGYKVEFAAGSVKDVAGNNFAGTTTYNFTTDAQAAIKVSSGAIVSGVISQNTIWEGDITLSGSVKINPNVSLTILPGAHISAQAGKSIMIWADTGARLYANGNAQNQITFESTGDGSGQWMGVRLNGNTVDSSDVRAESKLSYVTIKEASVGVHVSSQSLTIDNASFNGNTYGLWLGKDVNGINVNKSNFDGSGISTSYESEVVGPYSSTNSWGSISNIKISNNEFSNAGISIWPNQRNVSNVEINNNKINSSATAIMVGGGGYGSHIGGLSVHDNEITAQTGFSIKAYSWLTGGVEIKNNKFMPGVLNTNTGIFLDYTQGQPSGFSIEGNSFVNETYGIRGLDYYSSAAVLDVKGNLFIGNKTAIDVPKAKLNVSSNTFSGVTEYIYDHVYTTSTFANNNIFNFKGSGGFVRTRESVSGSNLSFNGNYFDATSSRQADYADDGSENFLYPTINFTGSVQNPNAVAVSYWPVWPNSAPVTNNLSLASNEDITNSGQLLATDTDSDTLVFSKVSNPSNGTVAVNTNGTFTYIPNANFNGTDSFTFKANDGTIDSAVATVSITVSAVNDAPVASAASITTNEDTVKTGTLTATDVDSTSLTFAKVASPTNGTVTVNTNGTYTYTPNANFNGTDSFTFKANDGAADSAAATVSITVSAVNDSPVGTIDITGTAKQGETLTATKNFTDVDGIPPIGVGSGNIKTSWLADGVTIMGTTAMVDRSSNFLGATLELTADHIGKKLSFTATYTDNGGTQETVTSAQTVAVVALKAGVTWSNASNLSTNESGTTATYGAVLDKAPTKDVTLTLTISDATEGVFVSTGSTTRDLVFTPSNWNQVQNVQVKGVDDSEYDRDVAYTISTKVTSSDLDYDGMRSGQGLATANVTVNNVDDDIPINWIGTDANDVKIGGPGADDLYGGYGRDDVSGGKGNDRIYGGYGDDVLSGEDGNDEIEGDQGDDKIGGGAGNDNLKGGTGADTLLGGDGSDILNGGEDADSMDGGNGADTYYVDNPGDVVEDTGTDNSIDILYIASYLSAPVLLGRGVENATLNDSAGKGSITGNDSNNTLNGNASDNSLSGGSGNDTLESGAGNDSVDAGTGDDLIVGGEGAGNDTYVGGTGTDTVKYTSAVNTILVNLLEGLANGQDIGTDKLSEIENLIGGQTGDTLIGDDNANNINAFTGNDTITGNGGNDTVDGGEGQDTVVYALNASNYTVTAITGGYQVVSKSGTEGTDTLLNVESFKFADQTALISSFSSGTGTSTNAKFWKDNTKAPTDTKKADAVNLTDAIAILKMIVGLNVNSNNTALSPYQAIAADFDQSGDVGLTDAIGVLKMVVGLSAPTPTWKYYDDTKLASAYTSAQSLNPKGWTTSAAISDTGTADSGVKLVGVLTGDVDGSWTGV